MRTLMNVEVYKYYLLAGNLFPPGWLEKVSALSQPRVAAQPTDIQPYRDSSIQDKPHGKHRSKLLRSSHAAAAAVVDPATSKAPSSSTPSSESFEHVPRFAADLPDNDDDVRPQVKRLSGSTHPPRPGESSSLPPPTELRGKDRAPNDLDESWTPTKAQFRNSDLLSALTIHRTANQNVVQKAFELNAASKSLFGNLGQLIPELESFMQQLEEFSKKSDLSADQISALRQLQENFQSLRRDHLDAYKSEQERFAEVATTIIHSLLRSGRYLDHAFKTNHIAQSVTRSPEPTLYSVPAEIDIGGQTVARSKSVVQYLSRLGDIDLIQEKLTDLYVERDQLQDEQEARRRFGLTLNDEALELLDAFKDQETFLLNELEYAVMVMEALRELVHDSEALKVSNEAYEENIEEDPQQLVHLDPAHQSELRLSLPPDHPASRSQPDSRLEHTAAPEVPVEDIKFADLYDVSGTSAEVSATARFIDTWMLHRIHSEPELLAKFTLALSSQNQDQNPEDLKQQFLDTWFDESLSVQFNKTRAEADKRSIIVRHARSQDSKPESISSTSQLSIPLPLLQTGPEMTAKQIIQHAIQTRSLTSSPSLTVRQKR
jgi:hypothetical protein